MKPIVLVTEPLASEPMQWLAGHCQLVEGKLNGDNYQAFSGKAQGIAIRTASKIDRETLEQMPQLKVIARAGVGLDHIDLAACKAKGVRVVHTPDANTQAVVEYVLMLVLHAVRPRLFLADAIDEAEWEKLRIECTATRQLDEMTVGILGLGRIGKRLAQVLNALGCKILFHDVLEIDREHRQGAVAVSAEELFAQCDLISIHIDGRDDNLGFVGHQLLRLMKHDATLINTSRGRVVDHSSLASFLRAHPKSRCLLDVHDPEPFLPTLPLLGLPNAHLAPHLASRTRTAVTNMSWVVRDLVAVLQGRTPKFEA